MVVVIDKGIDHFFRRIKHSMPNVSLLAPLLETGIITVDLAAHFKEDGKWRDHGVLFKMKQENIGLLLTNPVRYDLGEIPVG